MHRHQCRHIADGFLTTHMWRLRRWFYNAVVLASVPARTITRLAWYELTAQDKNCYWYESLCIVTYLRKFGVTRVRYHKLYVVKIEITSCAFCRWLIRYIYHRRWCALLRTTLEQTTTNSPQTIISLPKPRTSTLDSVKHSPLSTLRKPQRHLLHVRDTSRTNLPPVVATKCCNWR